MEERSQKLIWKALLGSALLLPAGSYALGLGQLVVHSGLNQKLNAEIRLLSVDDANLGDIQAKLASEDSYSRAGFENDYILTKLHFNVTRNAAGNPIIQVQTDERITEPYMRFLLELTAPSGHMYRAYTVLLDPAQYQDAQPVAPALQSQASLTSRDIPDSVGAVEPSLMVLPEKQTATAKQAPPSRIEAALNPSTAQPVQSESDDVFDDADEVPLASPDDDPDPITAAHEPVATQSSIATQTSVPTQPHAVMQTAAPTQGPVLPQRFTVPQAPALPQTSLAPQAPFVPQTPAAVLPLPPTAPQHSEHMLSPPVEGPVRVMPTTPSVQATTNAQTTQRGYDNPARIAQAVPGMALTSTPSSDPLFAKRHPTPVSSAPITSAPLVKPIEMQTVKNDALESPTIAQIPQSAQTGPIDAPNQVDPASSDRSRFNDLLDSERQLQNKKVLSLLAQQQTHTTVPGLAGQGAELRVDDEIDPLWTAWGTLLVFASASLGFYWFKRRREQVQLPDLALNKPHFQSSAPTRDENAAPQNAAAAMQAATVQTQEHAVHDDNLKRNVSAVAQQVVELSPLDEAQMHLNYGNIEAATDVLRRAVDANPEDSLLTCLLLDSLYELQAKDEFMALYIAQEDTLRQLEPNEFAVITSKAQLWLQQAQKLGSQLASTGTGAAPGRLVHEMDEVKHAQALTAKLENAMDFSLDAADLEGIRLDVDRLNRRHVNEGADESGTGLSDEAGSAALPAGYDTRNLMQYDPVSAKLELAIACITMHDLPQAREVLKQVCAEGDPAQIEQATSLLIQCHQE